MKQQVSWPWYLVLQLISEVGHDDDNDDDVTGVWFSLGFEVDSHKEPNILRIFWGPGTPSTCWVDSHIIDGGLCSDALPRSMVELFSLIN